MMANILSVTSLWNINLVQMGVQTEYTKKYKQNTLIIIDQ